MHGGATRRCFDGKSATHASGNAGLTTTAAAVDRSANCPAQPPDRAGHEAASGCRDPTGRGARWGSGFGKPVHGGGRRPSQYVSLRGGVELLGGNLSRQGGKCRAEPQ